MTKHSSRRQPQDRRTGGDRHRTAPATPAGSLAQQQPVPVTQGTLPTHKALFVTMLVGVVVIVTGLTYFPALTLGPLAEGL